MLMWALLFLVVAVIAGALGFGGIAIVSIELAKVIFWLFLVLFVVALAYTLVTGRNPRPPPM